MGSRWKPVTDADYRYVEYMMSIYPERYGITDCEKAEITNLRLRKAKVEKPKNKRKHRDNGMNGIRKAVRDRDGNMCTICGSVRSLQVHHIKHRADGGTNDMDNLITLCAKCHANEHKEEQVYNIMAKAVF